MISVPRKPGLTMNASSVNTGMPVLVVVGRRRRRHRRRLQRRLRRQEALRVDRRHVRREDEQRAQRVLQPAQPHVGVAERGERAEQPHHLHVAQHERRRRDPLAVVREAVDGDHVRHGGERHQHGRQRHLGGRRRRARGQVTHAVSELVLRRERLPKAEQEMGGRPSHAAPDASNGAQRRATEGRGREEGEVGEVAELREGAAERRVVEAEGGEVAELASCEERVPLSDVCRGRGWRGWRGCRAARRGCR